MILREIKKIEKYEKRFSRHNYNGSQKPGFIIVPGSIPVIVSAPHSVNQFRNGQLKWADKYTGSIAIALHKITNCHVIYASGYTGGDPNFDPIESNQYQKALIDYVNKHNIHVLIDLHGASASRPYAIELGTAPTRDENNNIIGEANPSLKGFDFIGKLLRLSLSYMFKNINEANQTEIWDNKIFDAGSINTVTKSISAHSGTSSIQLEINSLYRDPNNPELMSSLVRGLTISINILSKVNWNAKYIDVFRLKQTLVPVPQDKVEFYLKNTPFFNGDLAEINTFTGTPEHVRVKEQESEDGCIYFTNRLIHNVFNQEWRVNIGFGNDISLEDAPILVSDRNGSALSFPIGITKALQLDRVYLSTQLYNRLLPFSKDNQFIVYNRITDSRLYFDFCKETDYHDNPPVVPPERVMLPRYFKQLLGYNTFPFYLIRKEEYYQIPNSLKNKLQNRIQEIIDFVSIKQNDSLNKHPLDNYILNDNEQYSTAIVRISKIGVDVFVNSVVEKIREQLNNCYSPVDKTAFYMLNEKCDEKTLINIGEVFRHFGMYDTAEILIIPKQKQKISILSTIKSWTNKFTEWGLTRIIGKSDYLLTTCWTNITDDKNYVARLSPNIMSLLGVTDNDKVVIKYGNNSLTIRILTDPELNDYQIGIPANARTFLNMYSVNDVVVVSRDMRHTFKRNSQAQTIAILGTVLAVFQVIKQFWIGIILCLVFIPLILYFSLNEERIKVK